MMIEFVTSSYKLHMLSILQLISTIHTPHCLHLTPNTTHYIHNTHCRYTSKAAALLGKWCVHSAELPNSPSKAKANAGGRKSG